MSKKFDVDKFVETLDDDITSIPVTRKPNPEISSKRIECCPRCGVKAWKYMRYSRLGNVLFCSECRHVDNQ